ncbi:MAG TPA: hypothetical protein VK932_10835, partial [Kofleriaceae bacterium]|nr:hypothetical protein [Kofleriaceae bacterium]
MVDAARRIRLLSVLAAAACTSASSGHVAVSALATWHGAPGEIAAVEVTLTPARGVTGTQRVSFGVPLAPGQLRDAGLVRVVGERGELPAARRVLARHP